MSPPSGPGPHGLNPDRWVDNHGDALFAFAVRLIGDRAAAEDLVQETLLSALGAMSRFRGDSAERTWLVSILRHKAVDHLRARRATETDPHDADTSFFDSRGKWRGSMGDWSESAVHPERQAEFRRSLDECLGGLSPTLRFPIILRDMEGLESEEVCKVLGLTATNLWTRLHRARLLLQRCLESAGVGRGGLDQERR